MGYLIAGFIGACLLIWIVRLVRGTPPRLHYAARRRGRVAARGARAADAKSAQLEEGLLPGGPAGGGNDHEAKRSGFCIRDSLRP